MKKLLLAAGMMMMGHAASRLAKPREDNRRQRLPFEVGEQKSQERLAKAVQKRMNRALRNERNKRK